MLIIEQVCRAVDSYLKTLSRRGHLTADIYRRIVDAVPDNFRTTDDVFFDVLRGLLFSGRRRYNLFSCTKLHCVLAKP